jgi:DNA-binding transcriptional regulator GbsR (MarR family)
VTLRGRARPPANDGLATVHIHGQDVSVVSRISIDIRLVSSELGMARSNVSNSIRELLSWNLIRRVPIMGDRRDHYEAETDIWEVAARIAAGRKEREIDPAVDALRACVVDAADDPTISPVASKQLKEMLAFTELVDRWYAQMLTVPRPRLIALIKLGEKIVSFLPAGKSNKA